jgi:hypothetical protein
MNPPQIHRQRDRGSCRRRGVPATGLNSCTGAPHNDSERHRETGALWARASVARYIPSGPAGRPRRTADRAGRHARFRGQQVSLPFRMPGLDDDQVRRGIRKGWTRVRLCLPNDQTSSLRPVGDRPSLLEFLPLRAGSRAIGVWVRCSWPQPTCGFVLSCHGVLKPMRLAKLFEHATQQSAQGPLARRDFRALGAATPSARPSGRSEAATVV